MFSQQKLCPKTIFQTSKSTPPKCVEPYGRHRLRPFFGYFLIIRSNPSFKSIHCSFRGRPIVRYKHFGIKLLWGGRNFEGYPQRSFRHLRLNFLRIVKRSFGLPKFFRTESFFKHERIPLRF